MSIKTQQSQLSSIQLNEILDDEEFKELLEQELESIDLPQNFLIDVSQNFKVQVHSGKKKKHQNYDSEAILKQKNLMEQAYERAKRSGKLLSNLMLKFEEKKQDEEKQHENNKEEDYLSQYMRWKQEASAQKNKERKLKQYKKYDKKFFQKILEDKQINEPITLKKSNSFDSDNLNEQIKKIHQEYLQKITLVTSNNVFPEKLPLLLIEQNKDKLQKESIIQVNQMGKKQLKQKSKRNSIIKLTNEETQTQPYHFEDSDINEYCFENMIKRKPNFVSFNKAKKREFLSKGNSEDKKQSKQQIQKDIEEDYEIGSPTNIKSNLNNAPLGDSPSYFSQTNEFTKQTRKLDPQYQEVKQMIKSGYNPQILISRQRINSKQIPTKQISKPHPAVKLNVQKLLRLPFKEFLLFFDQNHRKIISMTQPEQYKRLQTYQMKCLEHAKSIHKLRERFSSEQGAKIIQRLSFEQKQKLFKILYQNQLE